MRLDLYVSKLENISRNKASELIKNSCVFVNEKLVLKPSFDVNDEQVRLKETKFYLSRAGEKLAGFLDGFDADIKGKTCLDIGSSTGGFVQVLLECGAKKVVAVDVGSEQLHQSLRLDERVELYEQTDIRSFTSSERYELVTCDISFISFKDVFESIDKFASRYIIILFKPQFEVGRGVKRNKKGVVCDKTAVQKAQRDFEALSFTRWELLKKENSKLRGKEGNEEVFYAFTKR